jgi:apolipoprotein N-acyltransferase
VIAPDGRILERLDEGEEGVLRIRVPPPTPSATLYARTGDALAIACLLACLASALAPRGRQRLHEPGPLAQVDHVRR